MCVTPAHTSGELGHVTPPGRNGRRRVDGKVRGSARRIVLVRTCHLHWVCHTGTLAGTVVRKPILYCDTTSGAPVRLQRGQLTPPCDNTPI